jgi:N-acetylglutamate synthase-like GNAT family acetyltransferase
MPSIIIREAVLNDIPALTNLTQELGYPDSEEEIRKRFKILSHSANHKIFVAEHNGVVVGLMSFHALDILYGAGKLGRITALVVTDSERGKGIGKLLVASAEKLARESGCKRLELTSNNRRVDAHKFFESLGYEASSKRFVKKV